MVKAAGYHGVENVKTVKRVSGESGLISTAISVKYAVNLALSPQSNSASRYADNRRLLTVLTDNGYDGSFGFTAQDVDLEKEAKLLLPVKAGGAARGTSRGNVRFDTYYEYIESLEDGTEQKVKCWMLNHTFGKPEENHATDTDSIEFGDYSYPVSVFGDPALQESSTPGGDPVPYVDENGMGSIVTHIFSRPGEDNYATFGASIPLPIIGEPDESEGEEDPPAV